VLASLAARRTDSLTASGHGNLAALTSGYHVAFLLAAIFSVAAAAVGGTLLRVGQQHAPAHEAGGETTGAVAAAEVD
jgi:hypothetical protein